jgi:hypothetical protein
VMGPGVGEGGRPSLVNICDEGPAFRPTGLEMSSARDDFHARRGGWGRERVCDGARRFLTHWGGILGSGLESWDELANLWTRQKRRAEG